MSAAIGLAAAYGMLGLDLPAQLGPGTVKALARVQLRPMGTIRTQPDQPDHSVTMITGVLLEDVTGTTDDELWDCDVYLVPKHRRRDTTHNLRGFSADGILREGLSPELYEEVIK